MTNVSGHNNLAYFGGSRFEEVWNCQFLSKNWLLFATKK